MSDMSKKCPNCGYMCDDESVFCPICNTKLHLINTTPKKTQEELSQEAQRSAALENIKAFLDEKKIDDKRQKVRLNSFYSGGVLNFVLAFVIISVILCVAVYFVIEKQTAQRTSLEYQNYVKNPSKIPELKEPKSFVELHTNLKEVEKYLTLYFTYSKDTFEKKEHIFSLFLEEMDKLPHISSEGMIKDDLDKCAKINSYTKAKYCAAEFSKDFSNVGIKAYPIENEFKLYADYHFLEKKYAKFFPSSVKNYLKLRAKYPVPSGVGLNLYMRPKKTAQKIHDFESLFYKTTNQFVLNELQKTLYDDFRRFIFSPNIYNTVTHEMASDFENAYKFYIKNYGKSQLRPVVMSYLDKQKSYTQEDFMADYPYKMYETTSADLNELTLSDIFVALRKDKIDNTKTKFTYVYSAMSNSWRKYRENEVLKEGEYAISAPDKNNNFTVFDNKFSRADEFYVPGYSTLFILNNSLYIYNTEKLEVSRVAYTGSNFQVQSMSFSNISSLFPGINIIDLDAYQNYNVIIEKANYKAAYLLLSSHSKGYENYIITPVRGNALLNNFPNLFTVASSDDVVLSFHNKEIEPERTSDTSPTYRIIIHTIGSNSRSNYDEENNNNTQMRPKEEEIEPHTPSIMPKILNERENTQIEEEDTSKLIEIPSQMIEPPSDD